MEKRRYSRVPFTTTAAILDPAGPELARGAVENLSLTGVLIDTSAALTPGTLVDVTIALEGAGNNQVISLKGEVVRMDAPKIAVKFDLDGVSLSSITHLRQVISYNLGDGDAVMDEIMRAASTDVQD